MYTNSIFMQTSLQCKKIAVKFNSSISLPDPTSYTWTRAVAASSSDDTVFPSGGVRGDDRPALHQENGGAEDRFAVRAGCFLYGCGAFFALKIQSAKSAKQMDEFAKEVANLEKLRGHSNIVQIRDHTIRPRSHHVVILMELAACDLDLFFKNSAYSLDVSSKLSIWHSLVKAVDAAHTQDIIHRDLKPQNFLLVPIAPPFADRILATTTVSSDKFEFRIVNRAKTSDPEKVGDVELSLKDSATGTVQVLQLIIKVSDFGLAQPLDLDAHANGRSHLSVRGHAGTIKYMAPETFQASEDAVQRLTKRVDIWALGVILFQMLHGGRTPFDRYCSPGNWINAAVAIASKDIHAKVMKFERPSVWAAEKKSLRCDPRALRSSDSEGEDTATKVCQSLTAVSLLSTEFLFRMCENCLSFEASDRVLAGDLKIWMGHLLDSNWWEETMSSLSDHAALEALLSGVSMKGDDVETASGQLDNQNLVQQGGNAIEECFFRGLRRAATAVAPPRHHARSGVVSLASSRKIGNVANKRRWPLLRREEALQRVQEDWRKLRDLDPDLQDDGEIVAAAVKQNFLAFQFASAEIRADKALWCKWMQRTEDSWRPAGQALEFVATEELLRDRDVWGPAVLQYPFALEHVFDADQLTNENIVRTAVEKVGMALAFAAEPLRNKDDIVLGAVQQNGWALKLASEGLQNDEHIVLAAVQQNGLALKFASERLRDKDDIVLAAVQQDGGALEFASERLLRDENIVKTAVEKVGIVLQFASERLRDKDDIVLAAVQQDGGALEFASERLRLQIVLP